MTETRTKGALVWIDCEMTGLDSDKEEIMSLCCFITDADMNMLDEQGYEAIIRHDKARLDRMDEWCTSTHGKSGLTEACIGSQTSHQDAATGLLAYIKNLVPQPRTALLSGNSVHADQRFLMKSPYDVVIRHLDYRILDVSSIKEAARRWASDEVLRRRPNKKGLHQAREDILESIAEARYYRDVFFKPTKTLEQHQSSGH